MIGRTTLLLVVLSTACGATTPNVANTPHDRLAPTTLYPMNEGTQWVYDVETGPEPPTLGIFEVIESHGNTRSIANNRGMDAEGNVRHGEPNTYEITDQGIRHVASGGWVLRAPIRQNAEWEGMGGRTARVVDVDTIARAVNETYRHCVAVEESGAEDGRTVRTVYCPEVGPVVIESRMESELTMRTIATRARLRAYNPGGSDEP